MTDWRDTIDFARIDAANVDGCEWLAVYPDAILPGTVEWDLFNNEPEARACADDVSEEDQQPGEVYRKVGGKWELQDVAAETEG